MKALSYRHAILITTGSSFLGRALAVVSGIILAKVLTPDLFGRFFSDQALVLIGAGFINLGVGQGYRQIVSRKPELRSSYLLPTILIRIGLMLLYFCGLGVYLACAGRWNVQILVVVIAVLLLNLLELFQIDLQICRSYLRVSFIICGQGAVLFVIAIACSLAKGNYDLLIFSYLGLSLLLIITGWFLVKPHITSLIKFDYRGLIKISVPFAASLFAYAFMSYWGLTYIRGLLGEEQAGYYAVPLKLYQVALVVGMSISGVTIPLYHKLAASKQFTIYSNVFSRLIRGTWLVSGPVVAICCFAPAFVVKTFASEQYLAALPVFPWVGFAFMFRLLAIPAGNIFESVDKQWYRAAIQFIGAVICAFAVSFIVPRWGIVGAAWALFLVDLWLMLAYWCVTRHLTPTVVSLRKLLVPGLVLSAILLSISLLEVSVRLKVLIFCGLWFGYVIFVLNVKEEVKSLLRKASTGA